MIELWIFCANMLSVYEKKNMEEKDWDNLIECVDKNGERYKKNGLGEVYIHQMGLLLDRISQTQQKRGENKRTA